MRVRSSTWGALTWAWDRRQKTEVNEIMLLVMCALKGVPNGVLMSERTCMEWDTDGEIEDEMAGSQGGNFWMMKTWTPVFSIAQYQRSIECESALRASFISCTLLRSCTCRAPPLGVIPSFFSVTHCRSRIR